MHVEQEVPLRLVLVVNGVWLLVSWSRRCMCRRLQVTGDDTTVLQCVLNADTAVSSLLQEELTLQQMLEEHTEGLFPDGRSADDVSRRLAVISDKLIGLDAASAESRASSILSGLQFSPAMQALPSKALSGGWRMR